MSTTTPLATKVQQAARRLSREVEALRFEDPVAYVYNPLEYAWPAHRAYLEAFARTRAQVMFLGMNPGPWGMSQTGVPFGEIAHVRDFLKIEAPVAQPPRTHPKRPVLGFNCTRSEVSGRRLWGAIAENFPSADAFFRRHFVANYCPLAFLEQSGKNRTPDKLPAAERAPLFAACDRHLRRLVALLEPRWVIGVGVFAEKRAREALAGVGGELRFGRVLHPSPANPAANRDWVGAVHQQLRELGLCP